MTAPNDNELDALITEGSSIGAPFHDTSQTPANIPDTVPLIANDPSTPDKLMSAQLNGPTFSTPLPNQPGGPGSNTQSTNKVNWLNSSYAGVDIHIVAHLYQDITDAAKAQATNDLQVARAVIEGANGIQSRLPNATLNISSSTNLNLIFQTACFPGGITDPIHAQALSVLQTNLGSFTGGVVSGNPVVTGQFITAAQNLFNSYSGLATELTQQGQVATQYQNVASNVLELGQCQTLAVQSARPKVPVRSCGKVNPNGFIRGSRTIAGSIIFTVFDEHPLMRLLRAMKDPNLFGELTYNDYSSIMIDQLPPIDLTIIFANEYGSFSRMGIYGVEFCNDGMTMSIEDLMLEDVVQFVATDIDIMTSVGMMKLSQANRSIYNKQGQKVSGSDLYYSNYSAYNSYCTQQLGLSTGLTGGNKTGGTP